MTSAAALVVALAGFASDGCDFYPDYGRPVHRDLQQDAGPPDGWDYASWSAQACTVFQATDPGQSVPQLAWLPCNNGITGCVVQDTTELPPETTAFLLEGVHSYGKRTIFVEGWSSNTQSVEAVYQLGKGPIAAWLSQGDGCAVEGMSLSEGGAIQQIDSGYYGSITSLLRYGSVDQLIAGTAPIASIDSTVIGDSSSIGWGELGATFMVLQVYPNGPLLLWDFGANQPKAMATPSAVTQDWAVAVRGNELLFLRSDQPYNSGIALRHADGSVVMLYQKPTVDIGFVESDGVEVVWEEITQPTGAGMTCEIWTSPWASDAASFKPHLVRACGFNWPDVSFSGGGYYLYDYDSTTLRAVRLSDGAHLDIPAPLGCYWSGWAGVIGSEIWSGVRFQGGNHYEVDTIARVPLASLGTPTP